MTITNMVKVLLLALPLVVSRLVVYGPQDLKDKFEYSSKYNESVSNRI